MDFKNFTSKEIHGGIQYLNFFPNGYGVSIIQHEFSFTDPNTWELAVLQGEPDNWKICYTTSITSDYSWGVLESLSDDEVNEVCKKVSKLNKIK
jgi:hypothetical protein